MEGPYSIGGSPWPGLSRLIEECGEVLQVAGKLIGANGRVEHFDGSDLRIRLREELGDLSAAIIFFVEQNGLDEGFIHCRISGKLALFEKWQRAVSG